MVGLVCPLTVSGRGEDGSGSGLPAAACVLVPSLVTWGS